METIKALQIQIPDITERIKNFDDVLEVNGINKEYFDDCCEGLSSDEKAYRMLVLLTKTLNEGWMPDWESGECKFWPYFYMGDGVQFDGRSSSYLAINPRLCFKNPKLCEYTVKQFNSLYKKYFM